MNRKIYIVLTNTGTLFTKMIGLFTRSPYNHASIALDENLQEVYSFGRKQPDNPFIGGFVKENLRTGLFKHATCAVYELEVTEGDLQRISYFIGKIQDCQQDYRYNFLGLFGVLFNTSIERRNAFFCSEFVANALSHSSEITFDKPLNLVTPEDLQRLDNVKLVFEGRLSDYRKEQPTNQLFFSKNYPLSI